MGKEIEVTEILKVFQADLEIIAQIGDEATVKAATENYRMRTAKLAELCEKAVDRILRIQEEEG